MQRRIQAGIGIGIDREDRLAAAPDKVFDKQGCKGRLSGPPFSRYGDDIAHLLHPCVMCASLLKSFQD
jgi:hypothetical protein